MRKKVSKILDMFSRVRPSLTLESANRLYKAMVLQILEYCGVVWHECGQGSCDHIERLQRKAARIVYRNVSPGHSTDKNNQKLRWKPHYERRNTHGVMLVQKCIENKVPLYFGDYFKLRGCDIHNYNTRNNKKN